MQDSLVKHIQIVLESLIVLIAYMQNIVNHLLDTGVTSVMDFHWLSQLRYYFNSESVEIKMLDSTLIYGCEYIGNQRRLVITPLTDRCYRIIFGALRSHFGIILEGVAGIGKTELIKDLAKDIAKLCVAFNCSSGLDYIALGKFFKGSAACGAW